ncbi:aldehyde dehydrogenase (NADP(+)) [Lacisediminihabitans sp. FW035]
MDTTLLELDSIMAAAVAAAPSAAAASDDDRARWLEAVAAAIDSETDSLVAIADEETHLGLPRLLGEVARTTAQLRLFAAVLRDGGYLEATIDHPNPNGTPPSPDLRRMLVPLGPVAVFSASNFPFAFSVAGGDTASALAVGNPVVVKAHPGHPELSVRTAAIVAHALHDAGAPDGIFALVVGYDVGPALVRHPATAAVGFTGSVVGGRALFDIASARPEPIPFYGELGSVNPVVITRQAAAERGSELASGLAGSFTLGAGQFCTKPGVVFVPSGAGFEEAVGAATGVDAPAVLLTEAIRVGFPRGLAALATVPGVRVIAGTPEQRAGEATAVVLATSVPAVLANPEVLLEECFGPVTLLIAYDTDDQLLAAIAAVPGSLTATVQAGDGEDIRALIPALQAKSGRLLFSGWPTGVAVNWAQHHGGPYPATTSLHSSVGASAVRRFLRPVAFQTAPASVLPPALQEHNPLGIPRRVDGVLGRS